MRNMMEYNLFREELAAITNEAIVDLGGRLDAYQRMFEEQIDDEMFDKRIAAAETSLQLDRKADERARQRTAELLKMLILMEAQVDP